MISGSWLFHLFSGFLDFIRDKSPCMRVVAGLCGGGGVGGGDHNKSWIFLGITVVTTTYLLLSLIFHLPSTT